jgi:hypothetical protein
VNPGRRFKEIGEGRHQRCRDLPFELRIAARFVRMMSSPCCANDGNAACSDLFVFGRARDIACGGRPWKKFALSWWKVTGGIRLFCSMLQNPGRADTGVPGRAATREAPRCHKSVPSPGPFLRKTWTKGSPAYEQHNQDLDQPPL